MCAACSNELKHVTNSNAYRLITGVGIFQTVYNLTLALAQKKYDLVITAGIAGDYNRDRDLNQMFMIEKSTFTDTGFEDEEGGFLPLIGSTFLDCNKPPFRERYIYNNVSDEIADKIKLPTATANTVSRTCTDPIHVASLLQQFPADLETMESAAYSYVCALQNVQYAEIRCTSNHILPKKQEKWQIDGALRTLGTHVDRILEEIC